MRIEAAEKLVHYAVVTRIYDLVGSFLRIEELQCHVFYIHFVIGRVSLLGWPLTRLHSWRHLVVADFVVGVFVFGLGGWLVGLGFGAAVDALGADGDAVLYLVVRVEGGVAEIFAFTGDALVLAFVDNLQVFGPSLPLFPRVEINHLIYNRVRPDYSPATPNIKSKTNIQDPPPCSSKTLLIFSATCYIFL